MMLTHTEGMLVVMAAGSLWTVAIICAVFYFDMGTRHARRRRREYRYGAGEFEADDDD